MTQSKIVLQASDLSKTFTDPVPVKVLMDINFSIRQGEFVSVTGKSGCGKSTLLYILSTMDTEYEGDLYIDGELMRLKSEKQRAAIRNRKIGFIFQFHYLLNEFTVLKNIILPGLKARVLTEEALNEKAMDLLRVMGISHIALKKAHQISGGEKQRVAIARALINDPLIIMADEPTGNLDLKNTEIVFDIFSELAGKFGQTLMVVTHDPEFAERTHRIIEMGDGRIL
ncbi:MAG: ABC transporter ATP-binding protein [Saprospiraceae bacterium]|nr:ABC transporter ATP-binding protein [Saprospiraceae bacterium]